MTDDQTRRLEKNQPFYGIYKTYSELDVYNLSKCYKMVQDGFKPKKMSVYTILAYYRGQTIF